MKTLKFTFGLVALLAVGTLFSACNDTDSGVQAPDAITIDPASPTSLTFAATSAGAQTITYTSEYGATAVPSATWVKVTNVNTRTSQTISVNVDPYTGTTSRSATITLTGRSSTKLIQVTQTAQAVVPTMTLAPSTLSFEYNGVAQEVTATMNDAQEIASATPETAATWITVEKTATKVTVTVSENTGVARTGKVTVTSTGLVSKDITVNQAAKPGNQITMAPATLTFEYNGAAQTSTATMNNGQAVTATAASDDTWITATFEGAVVTVSLSENTTGAERSGTVTVTTDGAVHADIAITQAAKPADTMTLTLEALKFAFDATAAQTVTATLNNGQTFTATGVDSWLHVTQDGNVILVSVDAQVVNASTRHANIAVVSSGAISKTIKVTQLGDPSLPLLSVNGEVADFDITVANTGQTNVDLDIIYTGEHTYVATKWFSDWLSYENGKWTATLNPTAEERETKIVVDAYTGELDGNNAPISAQTIYVTFKQAAGDVVYTVDPVAGYTEAPAAGSPNINGDGETKVWDITTTSTTINATCDETWVHITKTGLELSVIFDPNSSMTEERIGTITVTGTPGGSTNINVRQGASTVLFMNDIADLAIVKSPPSWGISVIPVTNAATFTVSYDPLDTWITSAAYNWGSVTVKCTANDTGIERSAIITVTAGAIVKTFRAVQAAN